MRGRGLSQGKRFGIAAILLLVAALVAVWVIGADLCRAHNHATQMPANLVVEAVTFPSASGSTIHGWLAASVTNRGVVVLQHGVRSDKTTLVTRAQMLKAAGYAVLMFDFQAHGESPGARIIFGHLESLDSRAAVAFVKQRFPGKPVGVLGVSMGAAAAALARPALEVQALVLEMVYPTIEEATKDRIEIRLGRFARCLSPLLTLQLPLRIGCRVGDLQVVDAVGKIGVPKLFMAGTEDRDTKFAEAGEIFNRAAAPKQFAPFVGARHQDLLAFSPAQYSSLVLNFFNTFLQ